MAARRWPSRSAWCATVSVAPELSNSAVLIVGIGHGPIASNGGVNSAGPAFGQSALNSGQSSLWSKSASMGATTARAQNNAPNSALKNMTSEKMNPLMLQRYDTSIRLPYSPRSDSAIASPNQRQSTHAKAARLRLNTMGAHVWPLIQPASENITPSNATAALARRAFAAGTSSTARGAAPPVRRCGTPHDLLDHWRPFKSMKRGRAGHRPFKPLRAFPRSGGRFFALIFTLRQINGQRNAQQKIHLH